MQAKAVLITGGDGYLGKRLAKLYLERASQPVSLWIRARDQEEFKRKGQQLCHELCETGAQLRLYWGDLRAERPFDTLDPEQIGTLIHTAAVTRFNVDRDTATGVNVEGTRKLLEFADGCQHLDQVALLSTIYASGLTEGDISEIPWDGKEGFSNFYEWSKWSSEQELIRNHGHLPWKILRIATIIADSEDGHVTQQNAFHNTLKLIYYGLLSILPGKPETPLYLVTGEFAGNAVFELMCTKRAAKIYHISHSRNESISLGMLIDLVFAIFEQEDDFKKRRILKPLYSDGESFQLLVDAVHQFAGDVVNQAVSSVAPFSKQLYLNKEIQNNNLVSALNDYHAPDPVALIQNSCRYLVQTRWGRK